MIRLYGQNRLEGNDMCVDDKEIFEVLFKIFLISDYFHSKIIMD